MLFKPMKIIQNNQSNFKKQSNGHARPLVLEPKRLLIVGSSPAGKHQDLEVQDLCSLLPLFYCEGRDAELGHRFGADGVLKYRLPWD